MSPLRQPLAIRLSHWLNVVFLLILVGSGLQIFNAHPILYASDASDATAIVLTLPHPEAEPAPHNEMTLLGRHFDTGSWTMEDFPREMTVGGWLAGARRWHLAVMWAFVANGLGYLLFLFLSGEAKRRFFRPRDASGLLPMLRRTLRLGPHPEGEGYNALQRLTYTMIVFFGGPLLMLTGLAMSPMLDAHFPWLPSLFGGRQFARTWHFFLMALFVAFSVLHVGLVALSGWPTFWSMVAGGAKREVSHG